MAFSVLMSVYAGEKPDRFRRAMDSVLSQTLLPDEIVLVRDGPVGEALQSAIEEYLARYPALLCCLALEERGGLGSALALGVVRAKHEWIARMDSDDVAVPDRFERQFAFLEAHPETDVCGGQIEEFKEDPAKPFAVRRVPTEERDILAFLKTRNPFNHMTVVLRRKAVLDAGNYADLPYLEDYFLWCRMARGGARFANLDAVLVRARVDGDTYRRRGGRAYFSAYRTLERYKLENGLIGRGRYAANLTARRIVHVLLPGGLRELAFHFVRSGRPTKKQKEKICDE